MYKLAKVPSIVPGNIDEPAKVVALFVSHERGVKKSCEIVYRVFV